MEEIKMVYNFGTVQAYSDDINCYFSNTLNEVSIFKTMKIFETIGHPMNMEIMIPLSSNGDEIIFEASLSVDFVSDYEGQPFSLSMQEYNFEGVFKNGKVFIVPNYKPMKMVDVRGHLNKYIQLMKLVGNGQAVAYLDIVINHS